MAAVELIMINLPKVTSLQNTQPYVNTDTLWYHTSSCGLENKTLEGNSSALGVWISCLRIVDEFGVEGSLGSLPYA